MFGLQALLHRPLIQLYPKLVVTGMVSYYVKFSKFLDIDIAITETDLLFQGT